MVGVIANVVEPSSFNITSNQTVNIILYLFDFIVGKRTYSDASHHEQNAQNKKSFVLVFHTDCFIQFFFKY